jgi:hypothetical protein
VRITSSGRGVRQRNDWRPLRICVAPPGGFTVTFPPDWKELIDLLSSNRVRFLIVGAHALAVHGRPRATGDLDLLVEPSLQNARRLAGALKAFGFHALAKEADAFAQPDRMATLGREPLRVDIMTSISGVSFAAAWRGRKRVRLSGRTVGVLGLREFIANKRASARPKDLLDIELLEEAKPKARRRPRTARR